MADGRTPLDQKVGSQPEDITPWGHDGARERPDAMSEDDKIPTKAMPMKQTPTPFKITGGGNGG